MALNFPDAPTNNQIFTDATTGEQWKYETSTNSWTSLGLTTSGGIVYKGGLSITAAPPTGVVSGWTYTVTTGGTANAGFTGLTGTIAAGSQVTFDGANWQMSGSSGPWTRTGTVVSPVNAGDVVTISAGTAALPGLTPVGDPNTGLWAPAADTLALSVKGGEALRIDDQKRVGIGVSDPGQILVIGGGTNGRARIKVTSGASNYGKFEFSTDSSSTASTSQVAEITANIVGTGPLTSSLQFATNAGDHLTNAMTIDSSQRVGIGSSTPGGKLVVSDGSTTFQFDPVGGTGNILRSLTSAGARDPLLLDASQLVYSNGGGERARIDSSGSLLIGTSSTASAGDSRYARLQVKGNTSLDSGFGIISVLCGTTIPVSGNTVGAVLFAGTTGNEFARIDCIADGTTGSGDYPGRLEFSTTADGASSPTERMSIKNNGTINFSNVAVYADNAAATTGGLAVGDVYRTSTGQLMIRY